MNKIKIGIMTMHGVPNYGAIMQSYATVELLKRRINNLDNDCGMSVEIIDFQPINKKIKYSEWALLNYIFLDPKHIILSIRQLLSKARKYNKMVHKYAFDFYKERDVISIKEIHEKELEKIDKEYDAVIVGSDQVWNPYGMDYKNPYLGGFLTSTPRYSFSSSFGITSFPKDYEQIYSKSLADFRLISVREEEGANIIKNITKRDDCLVTLDPTLMIEKEEYREYEDISNVKNIKNKYILVYIVMKSDSLLETAIINALEDDFILVLGSPDVLANIHCKDRRVSKVNCAKPEEFLAYFDFAKKVYTNSFHGIAFSVVFEKQVYIEYNNKYSKSNSRLENIVKTFELGDRVICGISEPVSEQSIDYKRVNEIKKNNKLRTEYYVDRVLNDIYDMI